MNNCSSRGMRYPQSFNKKSPTMHSLLLVTLCVAVCFASTNVGNIGFQVHSWNDLREWEQSFWKGVQWMKIDVQWMPADFCSNQSRVTQDPRGCFVLTHDTPETTVQYYSTQSVLEYITSSQHSHYFKQPDRKMYMALCFKYRYGDLCNQTLVNSQNWFSLTDDLFTAYNNAISNNNLNLEFILDGAAASSECTAQRWRPWVKTWSGPTDDPVFTTNLASDGSDRFMVLDPPINEHTVTSDPNAPAPDYWVTVYANQTFGKFANSPYPWLWWEPSNQDTIQTVSNTYLSTGQYHQPGFLFTTNTDPVLFQIFSASATKQAWNQKINSGSTVYTSRPLVSVLTSPSQSVHYVIVTFYSNRLTGTEFYYYVYSTNQILGQLTTVTSRTSLSTSSTSAKTNMKTVVYDSSSGPANATVMFDRTGAFDGYRLTPAGKLSRYCSGRLHSGTVTYSAVEIIKRNNQLFLVEAFTNRTSELQYQLYQFNPDTCAVTACGSTSRTNVPFSFNSLSIAMASSSNGNFEGIVTLSSAGRQINAAYVTMSVDSQCGTHFQSQVTRSAIDVGSNSIVSSVTVNNTQMIMEIHGDGYCWNSQDHNLNADVLMCDASPVSVSYVLAYNYGPIGSWVQHVQSNTRLSSCSPYLVSGSYDGGLYPFASVFSSTDGSKAGVVAVHQGISSSQSVAAQVAISNGGQDCGLPAPYSGILLDSWPLPASITPSVPSASRAPLIQRSYTMIQMVVRSGFSTATLRQTMAVVLDVPSSLIESVTNFQKQKSLRFKIHDTDTTSSAELATRLQDKLKNHDPRILQAGITNIQIVKSGPAQKTEEPSKNRFVVGAAVAGFALVVGTLISVSVVLRRNKKTKEETDKEAELEEVTPSSEVPSSQNPADSKL